MSLRRSRLGAFRAYLGALAVVGALRSAAARGERDIEPWRYGSSSADAVPARRARVPSG